MGKKNCLYFTGIKHIQYNKYNKIYINLLITYNNNNKIAICTFNVLFILTVNTLKETRKYEKNSK